MLCFLCTLFVFVLFQVKLTCVFDPNNFWCQPLEIADLALSLSDELYEAYNSLRLNDQAVCEFN